MGFKPLRHWGLVLIAPILAACPASLTAGPALAGGSDVLDGSDLFVEHIDDYYGYKNKARQTIIAPKYGYAHKFSEGLAAVMIGNKWGFINPEGVMIIKPEYNVVLPGNNEEQDFYQGTCLVKREPAFFLIDRKGKIVTAFPEEIREMKGFSEEGLAPACHFNPGKMEWGYVDRRGKEVVPFQFLEAYGFRDGLALVRTDEGFGFIDKSGKMAIKPRFEEAGEFHDGLASFRSGKKYGFIDKNGKVAIPVKFVQAGDFVDDLAIVKLEGEESSIWIDKDGKAVPGGKVIQIREASRDFRNREKLREHIDEQREIRRRRQLNAGEIQAPAGDKKP